jgi:hypothetical protein
VHRTDPWTPAARRAHCGWGATPARRLPAARRSDRSGGGVQSGCRGTGGGRACRVRSAGAHRGVSKAGAGICSSMGRVSPRVRTSWRGNDRRLRSGSSPRRCVGPTPGGVHHAGRATG